MSETIYYYGEVRGYAPEDSEEMTALIIDFNDAEVDEADDNKLMTFSAPNGWRGGGMSCEEIIISHFGEFLRKHPKVRMKVYFTYIDQAPTDSIDLGGRTNEEV